jgi:anthranilate synthase component 1
MHVHMNLSFSEFCQLAKNWDVIPIFQEMPSDLSSPVLAFYQLSQGKGDFLLESAAGDEVWGRYSFVGCSPDKMITLGKDGWMVSDLEGNIFEKASHSPDKIFEFLENKFLRERVYQDKKLPRFFGGVLGNVAYDAVYLFEKIKVGFDFQENPLFRFFEVSHLVIFDHRDQVMRVVKSVHIDESIRSDESQLKELYDSSVNQIEETLSKLQKPAAFESEAENVSDISIESEFERDVFKSYVKQVKEGIASGDQFQVVLSNRQVVKGFEGKPFQVYRHLRRVNPSPYLYYIHFGDEVVVGSSPEVLVRTEANVVHVRPIAGTRVRGKTEEQDLKLAEDLKADPKECAEHIMLVDLGRNDVGRIAESGSVKLDESMVIEKYSHVMHMVSHVSGKLQKDLTAFEALQACFPAGTLSGAPKVQAMKVIAELENRPRGVYGGAIGYVGYQGDSDFAIAIRTAVFRDDEVWVQAGAGIVHDSDPDKEYEECLNKARALIETLKKAG